MADWRGRGGGRGSRPGDPSFSGGAGKGGGRGARPGNPSFSGGPGKGGGLGSRPGSPSFSGGPGKGGGRGSRPGDPSFSGGAGKGGGRAGSQPSLDSADSYGELNIRHSIEATVDFGSSGTLDTGTKKRYPNATSDPTSSDYRAHSSTAASASGENSARVADPEGNFVFSLEIDKVEIAQFREASGLKTSTQVFELEEGGMNHRVHKLPGQSRWDNIVLRYGVCSDTSLLEWRNEILNDDFGNRRNGSIVVLTLAGEEVRRYNFVQGWPVAWEGPQLNAESAELAVEMIEIAHSGIQITTS
jgi:phage tail-like protein